MRDFSERYRGVQWFGLWADETADQYGSRDAINILADAAGRCIDEDMRERRAVLDALGYLRRRAGQEKGAIRFWKALAEPNPVLRFRAASDAVKALQRSVGAWSTPDR